MLAKIAILFVWLVLATNLIYPFPGIGAIALYILSVFLFCMHGLQLLIFTGAYGDKIPISGKEKCAILIFGIFELLNIHTKNAATQK